MCRKRKIYSYRKYVKWMCFFTDQSFAKMICEKAVKESICYECKCSDMETTGKRDGVICFYSNGDDLDNHKGIIGFMLENDLIKRTKTGKLYNISFKYDYQTYSGEYKEMFKAQIKLNDFLDLSTGEWRI